MAVVLFLLWGVEPDFGLESTGLAMIRGGYHHGLCGLVLLETADLIAFMPGQAMNLCVFSREEFQRQDAHSDQIRPMDPFKTLGQYGFDAEQGWALGGPVP